MPRHLYNQYYTHKYLHYKRHFPYMQGHIERLQGREELLSKAMTNKRVSSSFYKDKKEGGVIRSTRGTSRSKVVAKLLEEREKTNQLKLFLSTLLSTKEVCCVLLKRTCMGFKKSSRVSGTTGFNGSLLKVISYTT